MKDLHSGGDRWFQREGFRPSHVMREHLLVGRGDRIYESRQLVLLIPVPDALNGIGGCHCSAGMTYGLFGKFSAQPGRRDDLVTHLLQAPKLLERNSGCIQYIVSTSDEPEAVWVCEI